jgi:protein-tyrosine kinase
MSFVEKALQKLQASRPALEPLSPATADVERRASKPHLSVRQQSPTLRPAEAGFDPRKHSSNIVHFDRDLLRSLNVLPPVDQEREIATQFRTIKRPIIKHVTQAGEATDVAKHTVMVASALPGDGKTFTSVSLALSLALEMDFSVLLVDADAPKPHLTHTLRLETEPGLLDVLSDPARPLEDVILATDVPRLHVLPAGQRSETATELLASERMVEVVAHLATLYRRGIVLFDSPPILLTNESRSLASMIGQIVLVVRAGVTPQQAVKDAVSILGEGRRISLVLNSAKLDGQVGYYYGYQYGYGLKQTGPRSGESQ